jgi:RHS repeat-associated protein
MALFFAKNIPLNGVDFHQPRLGLVPYKSVFLTSVDVDPYGNIGRTITQYGTSGVERTEVTTTYAFDTANWLLRRPKTITTTDKGFDGQANRSETGTVEYTYYTGSSDRHLVKQTKSYASVAAPGKVLTVDYEYYQGGLLSRTTATDVGAGTKRETAFAYDPYSFPHAVRNVLGHTSYTGYDPLTGRVKVAVDPNGLRTDYTYDSLGRLVKTRLPGGVERTIAYSLQTHGPERLVQVEHSDATGAKTQLVTDRGGRPLVERARGFDGQMREKTHQYDALGRLVAATTAKRVGSAESVETLRYTYDDLGRPIKQTEPGNAVRTFQYDKLTVTLTDTRGHKTQTKVNERGLKVSQTDALGTPEETTRTYGYAPFGKLARTQVVGVAHSTSSFDYDANGRLRQSADAERGPKAYEYNAFGELTRRTEGEAATMLETALAYDALGRLDTRTVKQNGTLRSVTDHTYDTAAGTLCTTLGALLRSAFTAYGAGGYTHTTDFGFDGLGRPSDTEYTMRSDVTPTVNETLAVQRRYDSLNRLASVTYPKLPGQTHSTQVLYEYAPAATSNGRLLRIRALEAGASVSTVWEAEASDQQDLLSQFKAGNGVHTQHGFDWRGLTTSTVVITDGWDDEGDKVLAKMQFGHDTEGNLTSRADALQPATETFAYDPLNRLLASSTTSADPLQQPDDRFTYDKLGNLTSSTRRGAYTFDAEKPTQVVAVTEGPLGGGKLAYGYDVFGNQVSRPDGKVVYNDFNLPARYTTHAGVTTASFLYDAAGQRVRKVSAAQTVTYVPGLYERHRRADGVVEHRLLVASAGATLRYVEKNGALTKQPTLYTHGDHLGSTSLLTQQDERFTSFKAVVVEKRSYESFGLPRNPDWKSSDVFGGIQRPLLDQGYTGHDEDREHGLINMKGRIYDPSLGRFLTPDPFVDGGNATQRWNRYAYVSYNPLTYTDPSGFRYNLEALKQRVEAWTASLPFTGTIDTMFQGADTELMIANGLAGPQPCGNDAAACAGNPDAVRNMFSAAAFGDLYDRLQQCWPNCTTAQVNQILRDVARDHGITLKGTVSAHKNPLKEATPSVDGSISGNNSSGMSGEELDALVGSDRGNPLKSPNLLACGGPNEAVCPAVTPMSDRAGVPPMLPPVLPPGEAPPLPPIPKPPAVPVFDPPASWWSRVLNFLLRFPALPVIDENLLHEYQQRRWEETKA